MFARNLIPTTFRLLKSSETAIVAGPLRALAGSLFNTEVGRTFNASHCRPLYGFSITPMRSGLVDDLPVSSSWLSGGIQKEHHQLTPESKAELLVSCVGAHQTGVVRDLMKIIKSHGGQVVKSKSMTLGLKYCLMASVFVGDRDMANTLRLNLNDMAGGLNVSAIWIPDTYHEVLKNYSVHSMRIFGKHQFGVIHTMADSIAALGVQLGDMQSENVARVGSSEMQFKWTGTIEVPDDVQLDAVKETIYKLAEDNMLTVEFE